VEQQCETPRQGLSRASCDLGGTILATTNLPGHIPLAQGEAVFDQLQENGTQHVG
jgi:hypothetical protein